MRGLRMLGLVVALALVTAACGDDDAGSTTAPADLTQFALRNGGVFPADRLREIIDGRHVTSHGPREMPVWGDVFQYRGGAGDKRSVGERIEAIVRHLAAIQERRG